MKKSQFRKNSYAYKKYVAPVIAQEKKKKTNKIIKWLADNIFNIISTLVALIALAVSLWK